MGYMSGFCGLMMTVSQRGNVMRAATAAVMRLAAWVSPSEVSQVSHCLAVAGQLTFVLIVKHIIVMSVLP